jgi:hypothetical protein
MSIVSRMIIFGCSTDSGESLRYATVRVVGHPGFEQVEIVNRSGDKLRIDKDAIQTLRAALKLAQHVVNTRDYHEE